MEQRNKKIILSPLQKILGEEFNLGLILIIARKSFIWCILVMLTTMSASILYLRYTAPLYETSSAMLVKSENTSADIGFDEGITKKTNSNELDRDIEIMKSAVILDSVLKRLPLEIQYFNIGQILVEERYKSSQYEIVPDFKSSEIYGLPIYFEIKSKKSFTINYTIDKKKYFYNGSFNQKVTTPLLSFTAYLNNNESVNNPELMGDNFYFVINSKSAIESEIRNKLLATALPPSIIMSYQDRKPEKAADILNTIMKEFRDYDMNRRTQSSSQVLNFIDAQINALTNELQAYDNQIRFFRTTNGVINPADKAEKLLESLEATEKSLEVLDSKAHILDNYQSYFISHMDSSNLLAGIVDPSFSNILKHTETLDELQTSKKDLLLKLKEPNPQIVNLNDQINEVKKNLLQSITNEKKAIEKEKSLLNQEYAETKKEFAEFPLIETQYDSLEQLSNLKQKYYLQFLDIKSKYNIDLAGFVSNYIIVKPAAVPNNPVSPQVALIKILGIFSGVVICLLLIVTRYFLSNKIISVSEVEKFCDAGLIGVIPIYKKPMDISQLVVNMSPKSMISESFRSIRTNLDYIQSEKGPKMISVTSTIAGEGKTFIAVNVAGIHAVGGKRTIILDFDLRKPRIHKSFGTENNKGLSTILIGKYSIEECIKHSEWDNLDFITSGPVPPNPSEFIMSKQSGDLLEYLKSKYDIIVIDTPPIGVVTDALELMKKADYPIYVVRASYSNRNFLNNVNRLIYDNKITRLSVVLNSMGEGASGYSYNYGYGYGYGSGYNSNGHGYGYYSDAAPPRPKMLKRVKKYLLSFIKR